MRVQDLDYTQNDWKAEVMNDDTILGFQEWLQHKQEADRLSPAEAQQHQTENLVAALTRAQERITEDIAERQVNEEEARWPICPECLTSLEGELQFGPDSRNMLVPVACSYCGLEFGVKSTEEVKPIE